MVTVVDTDDSAAHGVGLSLDDRGVDAGGGILGADVLGLYS